MIHVYYYRLILLTWIVFGINVFCFFLLLFCSTPVFGMKIAIISHCSNCSSVALKPLTLTTEMAPSESKTRPWDTCKLSCRQCNWLNWFHCCLKLNCWCRTGRANSITGTARPLDGTNAKLGLTFAGSPCKLITIEINY